MKDFLNTLASSEPVPGGGSVSALAGALAASLATMVARLTTGRKKYVDVEPRALEIISMIEPQIDEFYADIQRDADAYASVMTAFKLPKESDSEKAARNEAIEKATIEAVRVPIGVAQRALKLIPLIDELSCIGNQNAVTDAAVAALCCNTAVQGALLNVAVNLPGINDKTCVEGLRNQICAISGTSDDVSRSIIDEVFHKLGVNSVSDSQS